MMATQDWNEHWSFKLAKVMFWVGAGPVIVFGALTMWGLPGPTLPEWFFFGMSPQQQFLAYPITALAAVTVGLLLSAPFWIATGIAYLVTGRGEQTANQ